MSQSTGRELPGQLFTLVVRTYHPEDYVLVNELDGTRWRGTLSGEWRSELEPILARLERVKGLLEEGKMSQRQIADLIGLSSSYITYIGRGVRLQKALAAVGVDMPLDVATRYFNNIRSADVEPTMAAVITGAILERAGQ